MKVLLVDDHTLIRRAVAQVLALWIPGAEVTEVGTADEAVAVLASSVYDVALVDVRMPGRDGLALLKEIRVTWPSLPVIMLTAYDASEYVRAALAAGAAGYLLKDSTPEDLTQAISVALSGSGNVLSPRAVRNLFEEPVQSSGHDGRTQRPSDVGLTPRETDILVLLVEGHSNRTISRHLFLSEKTVKAHLAAVFRKLSVSNRTQAAMAAVAMGMGQASLGNGGGNGHAVRTGLTGNGAPGSVPAVGDVYLGATRSSA
jgi:DNA-binding NarL/FixJ family response regulator